VVALLGRLAFPTDYRAGFPGATARDELTSDLVPRARFPLVFRVPLLGPALDAYNALISEMTLHGVGLRQEEHRLFLQKAREEGTFLAELVERGVLRPDTHIAIGSVGAIPYYSGLRTMDRLGLTDRAIARGPERAPGARIMAHSKVASIEYAIEQGIDLWASDHTFLVVKPHDPRMSDFAAKAVELGVPLVAAPATPRGILLALAPSWKTDGGSRLPAFADAAAFYRKLTSLPNSPWWASSALGDLLAARGDVAGATAAYQRALGLDSTIVRAEHRLGKLLLSAGDLETGIRHLSRAHSLDPRNQRVRVDLADALALAARYGEALALLQDGVRANPASIDMWTTLARFYAGCPDPAVRDSKRAVIIAERMRSETYDQDPNVLDALAAAYAAAGRFGDARAVALEASRVARRLGSDALADEIDRKAALYARNEPMFERSLPEAASE
jgi:tetratricopeptide (TPR) repeat protein